MKTNIENKDVEKQSFSPLQPEESNCLESKEKPAVKEVERLEKLFGPEWLERIR